MSLKPEKVNDARQQQQKMNVKMKKKQKPVFDKLPPYTFIVSEGTKTEVTYINGFAQAINKKYASFSSRSRITILGTGRNCQSLLSYARRIVNEKMPQASVVWLMYDKDDFPLANFDNTQFSAEQRLDNRTYKAAWSNESLELWFVLHFQDFDANVGRERYIEILKGCCEYRKNDPLLFEKLSPFTDIAIERAQKQYDAYPKRIPPSQRCPATRVFELVKELKEYL